MEAIGLILLSLAVAIAYKKYLFYKWSREVGQRSIQKPGSSGNPYLPDLSDEDFSEGKPRRRCG